MVQLMRIGKSGVNNMTPQAHAASLFIFGGTACPIAFSTLRPDDTIVIWTPCLEGFDLRLPCTDASCRVKADTGGEVDIAAKPPTPCRGIVAKNGFN